MGRSNGVFPFYEKIDTKKPPANYWNNGSRRCRSCGFNWPNFDLWEISPCCGGKTDSIAFVVQNGDIMEIVPDVGWNEAVVRLLRYRFEQLYLQWNEGLSDEELSKL